MNFVEYLDESTVKYCIGILKLKRNHKAILWLLKAVYDIDVKLGSKI